MEIWNPTPGDSLDGQFEGFADFSFSANETTFLPVLRVKGELIALPNHFKINQAFKAELDRLNVGSHVFIKAAGERELPNGRRMAEYIIEIDERLVSDHRIFTPAELRARLSKSSERQLDLFE